ncbi:hypothetical protein BLA18110_00167 [Burkholderia lata]|uniref:hypothetical protein n=1 Tax=Burkholderia lata (strain ATCC 17760 / DSM 23089 / LMG 22485 / NCIMB 9086 / R18194 / 383) TaxID=482957 RepID=UPI001453C749|nr:hypothetical protein [Burkholderia lata]VWC55001.1 hypothetical protein BLA18110_00167 [Burkholderia lata]
MAIKKNVVLVLTGATAGYHVIGNVSIDVLSGTTVASLNSYVSEDTYKSGKQPLQLAASISVEGVPEENEGALPYIHRRLIEAKPEDDKPAADRPMMYNAVDRYMLAGGVIVA